MHTFIKVLLFVFYLCPVWAREGEEHRTKVVATQPVIGTIEQISDFFGTVKASQSVTIKAEVTSKIKKIYFKEGHHIKEGDLLFSLDNAIYKAKFQAAEAALNLSKENLRRANTLYNKGAGTKAVFDQSLSQFEKDQSFLTLSSLELDKTLIKAPFDGLIGFCHYSQGAYVKAGDELVSLEDLSPLYIYFLLPEIYIGKIKEGETVTIVPVVYPKKRFLGNIQSMDSKLDPDTKQLKVKVILHKGDILLRPGNSVRVRLKTGNRQNVILVPQLALTIREKGAYVYRIIEGKAIETPVKIGWRQKEWVEIKKGLKIEDTIAYEGIFKLSHEEPIEIVEKVKLTYPPKENH